MELVALICRYFRPFQVKDARHFIILQEKITLEPRKDTFIIVDRAITYYFPFPPGCPEYFVCRMPCTAELVETDPYGTFYHFASGIWREVENHGDPCKVRRRFIVC